MSKFVFTESVLEKLIRHKRLNKLSIFEKQMVQIFFVSIVSMCVGIKCDLFDKLSSETPPPSNI